MLFEFTPDFGASKGKNPVVSNIQFGDGYSQRIAKGINNQPETWNLTFSNRTQAEGDAIDAFLEARGGVEPFDWETPEGVVKQFICSTWNVATVAGTYRSVTATFTQVFDV